MKLNLNKSAMICNSYYLILLLTFSHFTLGQTIQQVVDETILRDIKVEGLISRDLIIETSNLLQFNVKSVRESKLIYPTDLKIETILKVGELWTQIKEQCPACSTGVTIGGTTITGGNTDIGIGPLFKPNIGICEITSKSELTELRRKASEYDRMKEEELE
jgi:hypothetical protein